MKLNSYCGLTQNIPLRWKKTTDTPRTTPLKKITDTPQTIPLEKNPTHHKPFPWKTQSTHHEPLPWKTSKSKSKLTIEKWHLGQVWQYFFNNKCYLHSNGINKTYILKVGVFSVSILTNVCETMKQKIMWTILF
jgi:hypothetical protein